MLRAQRGRVQRLEGHLSSTPAAAAPKPRPFGLDDMFRMQSVASAQLSPDGKYVAFTVTATDRAADSSETALWMASAIDASVQPIRMTARGTSADSPRWSPDSLLLTFLSSRPEPGSDAPASSQVWGLRLLGGEAFKLTAVETGVLGYSWSPDASRPRLLLSVRDDLTPTAPEDDADEVAAASPKAEPWVMDSLEFKQDYVGYLDVTRGGVHLWVQEPAVPSMDAHAAAPTLTQITSGKTSSESAATWSPDGRLVAFASNRTAEPDSNTSANIWVVSADNTDKGSALSRVTASEGAGDSSPAWSPDGQWIAYTTRPNADAQVRAGGCCSWLFTMTSC
jgi:Tol biopolymer transport system component